MRRRHGAPLIALTVPKQTYAPSLERANTGFNTMTGNGGETLWVPLNGQRGLVISGNLQSIEPADRSSNHRVEFTAWEIASFGTLKTVESKLPPIILPPCIVRHKSLGFVLQVVRGFCFSEAVQIGLSGNLKIEMI